MDVIWIRIEFFDRIYKIDGIFFACGEVPSAEGRSIPVNRLILSNCFSKIRIQSSSFSIKTNANTQSMTYRVQPLNKFSWIGKFSPFFEYIS